MSSILSDGNENVGIITEDADGLSAFSHHFQHVAAEGDVFLIVGNDTVQLDDELLCGMG